MQEYIKKADVLIEAIPYIRKFADTTVVVKYGGSAMSSEKLKNSIIQDISMLKYLGVNIVVVHGGGKDITNTLKKMNKETQFINGLRVTDKETAKIAEMVLSGSISKGLVQDLQSHGLNAVGVSGKDGNTLEVSKEIKEVDLGFVGKIDKVNTELIDTLLEKNYIPVFSPIASDEKGNTYNINADYAASAIAAALKAQKLIFLTDTNGILENKDNNESSISRLTKEQAKNYIKDGTIKGGMIPKVQCCIEAVEKGVKSIHILDGNLEHSILLEIFTSKGCGTMMFKKGEFNE
ncbi:MAG: acetylglutamate kinase [Pleomorphochaeta sp.]